MVFQNERRGRANGRHSRWLSLQRNDYDLRSLLRSLIRCSTVVVVIPRIVKGREEVSGVVQEALPVVTIKAQSADDPRRIARGRRGRRPAHSTSTSPLSEGPRR